MTSNQAIPVESPTANPTDMTITGMGYLANNVPISVKKLVKQISKLIPSLSIMFFGVSAGVLLALMLSLAEMNKKIRNINQGLYRLSKYSGISDY